MSHNQILGKRKRTYFVRAVGGLVDRGKVLMAFVRRRKPEWPLGPGVPKDDEKKKQG